MSDNVSETPETLTPPQKVLTPEELAKQAEIKTDFEVRRQMTMDLLKYIDLLEAKHGGKYKLNFDVRFGFVKADIAPVGAVPPNGPPTHTE